MIKIILCALLLAMVASLIVSLVFLVKEPHDKTRSVKALTVRVAIAVCFVVFLVIAYLVGWLQPHGLASPPA